MARALLAWGCSGISGLIRAETASICQPGIAEQGGTAIGEGFRQDLRTALESGGTASHYQPVVTLHDGALVGFEVLSRWWRPGHGIVPPERFVQGAEDAGLICVLTENMLRRACQDARCWPDHAFLSLNVSPLQLRDANLSTHILALLDEAGFPPARLEVEITETALITDLSAARQVLGQLGEAGIRIALDDFGTGYSSLFHLQALKFDKLKIDRSFIHAMEAGNDAMNMVDFTLELGARLGLVVTAEGIEDRDTAALLLERGCQQGQGFLYGRPMPAAEIARWLQKQHPVGPDAESRR